MTKRKTTETQPRVTRSSKNAGVNPSGILDDAGLEYAYEGRVSEAALKQYCESESSKFLDRPFIRDPDSMPLFQSQQKYSQELSLLFTTGVGGEDPEADAELSYDNLLPENTDPESNPATESPPKTIQNEPQPPAVKTGKGTDKDKGKEVLIEPSSDTSKGEAVAGESGGGTASKDLGLTKTVRDVYGQTQDALSLEMSGLLEEIKVINKTDLSKIGFHRLITTFSGRTLSPGVQVMFAVGAKHYYNLPEVSYDQDTLWFLYLCIVKKDRYNISSPNLAEFEETFKRASDHGLDTLFKELGLILITTIGVPDYSTVTLPTPSEFRAYLVELSKQYMEAVIIYRLAAQFVHGGINCIQPVPALLIYERTLHIYLSEACKGKELLSMKSVRMEPLQDSAQFVTIKDAGGANLDDAPEIMVTKTKPVAQPTSLKRSRLNFSGSSKTGRTAHTSSSNQLLAQKPPTGRDKGEGGVSSFATSVGSLDVYIKRLEAVEEDVREIKEMLKMIVSRLGKNEEQNQATDQSLAGYIELTSKANLHTRQAINKSLVVVSDPAMQKHVSTSTTPTMMKVQEQESLLSRVENFSSSDDIDKLVADLKESFLAAGNSRVANAIVPNTIKNRSGRVRLIELLQGVPKYSE